MRADWKYGDPITCEGPVPRTVHDAGCDAPATFAESSFWTSNGLEGVSIYYWCDDHKPPLNDHNELRALVPSAASGEAL